jgi:hypothetical protein
VSYFPPLRGNSQLIANQRAMNAEAHLGVDGYGYRMEYVMNWLKSHAYIAVWLSPIATIIGFLIQSAIKPAERVNWSMVMVYVAFLTCLAVMVTPGVEPQIRWIVGSVGGMAFGFILVDAARSRG